MADAPPSGKVDLLLKNINLSLWMNQNVFLTKKISASAHRIPDEGLAAALHEAKWQTVGRSTSDDRSWVSLRLMQRSSPGSIRSENVCLGMHRDVGLRISWGLLIQTRVRMLSHQARSWERIDKCEWRSWLQSLAALAFVRTNRGFATRKERHGLGAVWIEKNHWRSRKSISGKVHEACKR